MTTENAAAERAKRLLGARAASPITDLETALATRIPDEEITVETVGEGDDLSFLITAPAHVATEDVTRVVREVLPVTVAVEVEHLPDDGKVRPPAPPLT